MWIDKKEQSNWALKQCIKGNDTTELRDLLIGIDLYMYCKIKGYRKELMERLSEQSLKTYASIIDLKNRLDFYDFMRDHGHKINNVKLIKTRRKKNER